MSTIAEKLQLTLATKENIRRAIEKKGVTVGNAPFHEYPSKIASIGIDDSEWRELDWIDIQQVRLLDTEDYIYKSIYLLDDSRDTIILQGGDAYKTSDSNELITEGGEYTFTGAGDVECSKGYKTRWVMVYRNTLIKKSGLHPSGLNNALLWVILDGMETICGFSWHVKLRYIDTLYCTEIEADACVNCCNLRYISGLSNLNKIYGSAFSNCHKLKSIDITSGVILYTYAFANCTFDYLKLDGFTYAESSSNVYNTFVGTTIKNCYINNPPYTWDIKIDAISNLEVGPNTTGYQFGKLLVSSGRYISISGIDFVKFSYTGSNSGSNITRINKFLWEKLNFEINMGDTYESYTLFNNHPTIKEFTITDWNGYNKNDTVDSFRPSMALNCPNLETFSIDKSNVVVFRTNFLYNCPMLKSAKVCGVKRLENYLTNSTTCYIFSFNERLESLDLPDLEEIIRKPNTSTTKQEVAYLYNLPKLKFINLPKLKTWNNSILNYSGLEEITIPNIATNITNCLCYSNSLKRIMIEDGCTVNVGDMVSFANNCSNLEYVYLPSSLGASDTSTSNNKAFANCPKLTTIELGQGYSKTLYLKHISTLSKECVVNILNALADLTGQEAQILYLHETTLGLLSDEEKAIATNKNWTLG